MERAVQIFADGMKGLSLVSLEKAGRFVGAGIVLLAFGLYVVWLVAAG